MFKNDTMTQYVTDRAPRLAPRAPRRPNWTAAACATEGRKQAIASIGRPAAPVFNIEGFRLARRPLPVTVA